jgi:hypothetical protein
LGTSHALSICNQAEYVDESLVRLTGFGREARHDVAEVIAVKLRVLVDSSGQKALTQGAEGHQSDTQLFERGQNLLLGLAPPEGVLALQRSHRLNGMRAPDRRDAGLGQTTSCAQGWR